MKGEILPFVGRRPPLRLNPGSPADRYLADLAHREAVRLLEREAIEAEIVLDRSAEYAAPNEWKWVAVLLGSIALLGSCGALLGVVLGRLG